MTMNFDILNIAQLENVRESPDYKGGVQDFGNFDEGYCIKVKTHSKDAQIWIICTGSTSEKEKLMDLIRKIKLKMQRDQGLVVTGPQSKPIETLESEIHPEGATLQANKGGMSVSFDSSASLVDGYWIIIHDWSQCSLKCGGGESLLQRMCIPPKNGGKPCHGEAILRRRCNLDPCPGVFNTKPSRFSNTTVVMAPSVKIMPFSARPQRYSKCIIKEADLMYTLKTQVDDKDETIDASGIIQKKSKKEISLQLPSRVIMNNKTFTVYGGDSYDSLKATFDLPQTNFSPSLDHELCFILRDPTKSAEFCFFSSENTQDMYDQWDYDFNLFKYQCRTKKPILALDRADEEELKHKMQDERNSMLLDQEKELRKKEEYHNEDEIQGQVSKTHKIALQAIQKELNLDAMIEKEENQREELIEEKLRKEIEEEKRKQKCAMEKIKEKELENQYNLRVEEKAKELEEVKKKAQEEIIMKRNNLKKKVLDMRKKAKRNQSKLKQELINLRMKMANDLNDAWKKGNGLNCKEIDSEIKWRHYCMKAFPNNPVKFGECKNTNNVCEFCCRHEFSDVYPQDRAKCIDEICPSKKLNLNGKWVWEESVREE